jgi:hypothetical protein
VHQKSANFSKKFASVCKFGWNDDVAIVVQNETFEIVRSTIHARWIGTISSDVSEQRVHSWMLELKTNDRCRCRLAAFFVEHSMSGCDQRVIFIGSIERHSINEAVGFNKMLVDGSSIPYLVDGFFVRLAELISEIKTWSKSLKQIVSITYSGLTSSFSALWSCHLNSPECVAKNETLTPNLWLNAFLKVGNEKFNMRF